MKTPLSGTVAMAGLSLLCTALSGPVAGADGAAVAVSIKPLHSLVQGVLGDTGRAALIIAGSPHAAALRPSQVRMMREARIVFYVDEQLEPALFRAITALPGTVRAHAITQIRGLTLLRQRPKHDQAHGRSPGPAGGHATARSGHESDRIDSHVWLDIGNAEKIVNALASELSAVFPDNRSIYQANADRLTQRLRRLDNEIRERLQPVRDRPYIVFHDAYRYFEKRYGLNNAGSIALNPGMPFSAKRIHALRARMDESGAACVFHEPQFPHDVIDVITSDGAIRTGELDPIGANLTAGAAMYFRLLDQLAMSLAQCLGGSSG